MMRKLFWAASMAASLMAGVYLLGTLLVTTQAAQQAASSSSALAMAVIPYCFAQAVTALSRKPTEQGKKEVAP